MQKLGRTRLNVKTCIPIHPIFITRARGREREREFSPSRHFSLFSSFPLSSFISFSFSLLLSLSLNFSLSRVPSLYLFYFYYYVLWLIEMAALVLLTEFLFICLYSSTTILFLNNPVQMHFPKNWGDQGISSLPQVFDASVNLQIFKMNINGDHLINVSSEIAFNFV